MLTQDHRRGAGSGAAQDGGGAERRRFDRGLEQEKLLDLYSPALAGPKTNLPTFQKLQKARQMAPFGVEFRIHPLPLFLNVLFEKLNAKERADLIKTAGTHESGSRRLRRSWTPRRKSWSAN